jgi:hypothetical protein
MTLHARRNRRNEASPWIEFLEDRSLPATFGIPWGDARLLTLSFAPDGTAIVGHTSTLFQTLNSSQPTADWQREILQAFQTWAVEANINIGLKSDGGQPIGTPGKPQHDARFGDVRVVAQPMAADALAISVPGGSLMAGTWSGDMFLNSLAFGGPAPPNLFGVALHEAGHVFGQDDSADPLSPMYLQLSGAIAPTATDIASLQQLFGARAPDDYEGSNGNETIAKATQFPIPGSYNGDRPLVLFGDRTTATDVDVYEIRAASNYSGPLTVRLQSAGLSLLAPHLKVTDAKGLVVGEAQADSGFGDTVIVHLASVTPGAKYYLQVDSQANDVFNIGDYSLAVTFDATNTVTPAILDQVLEGDYGTPDTTVVDAILRNADIGLLNNDKHSDDTATAAVRPVSTPGYAPNSHYDVLGSLSDLTDTDFYRIRSPHDFVGPSGVMTVVVRALDDGGVAPSVSILDGDLQAPVPARILTNGDGTYTIEATGIAANSWYYLRVPGDSSIQVVGNYELVVDFPGKPTDLSTFAFGTIDGPASPRDFDLYVADSQLFELLLSAGPAATAGATVRMVVSNSSGVQLYSIAALAGQTVSGDDLFLTPGTYTIQFVVVGANAPMEFVLSGESISNPVGPSLADPTLQPIFTAPGSPGVPPLHAFPGGAVTTRSFLLVAAIPPPPNPSPPPPGNPGPTTGPDPGPTTGPNPGPTLPPLPPSALGIASVGRSKKGVTSVSIGFDTALDPGSASNIGLYKMLRGIKKHGKIVYNKALRIRSVHYDVNAHTVTIRLAVPFKGPLQVTLRAGILSLAGAPSTTAFTKVVR